MATEPIRNPMPFDQPLTAEQVDAFLADVRFARESGAGPGFVIDRYPHLMEQAQAWHAAQAAPVLPQQPMTVAYVPGAAGQPVATYVPAQAAGQPVEQPAPAVSPLLVNAALAAAAFAGIGVGLHFLAEVIDALAHLLWAAVVLAAILCGAPVALQLLRGAGGGQQQTVIHAKRVKVGRIINRGGAR